MTAEDDRLPTDDDISSCNSETERDGVASNENIAPGSGSDDDLTFIVGVSQDSFCNERCNILCSLTMDSLYLLYD